MPRKVLPGGSEIEGHHFPAVTTTTVVGTPHYAIHHNEFNYPEPFTFNLSRSIEASDTTEASIQLAQSDFCPFSIGPRAAWERRWHIQK